MLFPYEGRARRRTVIMSKRPSEKPPALPKLSSPDGKSTKTTGRPHLSHRGGKSTHRGASPSGLQSDRKQSGALSHLDKTADKSGRMDKPKAKAKASPQHHRTLMSSVAEAPPEVSVPDLVDAASFDDGLELDLAADQAAAEARELELEKQPSATETAAAEEVAAESTAAERAAVRAPANRVSCRFWMIKADFLRTFSGTNLPFFQELREGHPSAFVEVTISYEEVVCGTHVEKILSISHCWTEKTQPDPDGEQLKAIQAFLVSSAGKRIELVWIDGGSMPQHQPDRLIRPIIRSVEDTADFKTMLSQVYAAFVLRSRLFVAILLSPLSHLL